jgi:hypothetical protein
MAIVRTMSVDLLAEVGPGEHRVVVAAEALGVTHVAETHADANGGARSPGLDLTAVVHD